ncbi:MAG: threonine efflux protein [Verrucomicrobiales bacterium]|jgi:threonine efflux protein
MAVGQFSPGPDLLLIMKNSIACSRQAALSTVLGTSTGIVLHTTIVITGLAAFSEQIPGVLSLVWLAGACYLGWLGFRLVKNAQLQRPATDIGQDVIAGEAGIGCGKAYIQGLITNLTNPKVFLFFTSMMAATLPPGVGNDRRILFGGILIAEALVLWSLFVLFLQWPPVARLYARSIRWINAAFGILLLWIAATVFWSLI